MKTNYNSRQQKIFEDYSNYSTDKLLEYIQNASKYNSEVIDIINDILSERDVIEKKPEELVQENEIIIDTSLKQRHGCITAYLSLVIILNSLIFFLYLITSDIIADSLPGDVSPELIIIIGALSLFNVFFAVQILKWKKWGFYGVLILSLIMFVINLSIGVDIGRSVSGLIGIAVLYGVLQAKKNNISAWDLLE